MPVGGGQGWSGSPAARRSRLGREKSLVAGTFFDLVFVTTVSLITRILINAEHHPEQVHQYFGEFLLMVFPMFWLWAGQTMLFNRYSDEINHPAIYMLLQMFCLILMTVHINFDFNNSTYHIFLLSYLGFRALTVAQYVQAGKRRLDDARCRTASVLSRLFTAGAVITGSSIFFSGNWRYTIMYAGIFADIVLPLFFRGYLKYTPVNLPHLSERLGLFVLIAFGESLVSITDILSESGDSGYSMAFAAASFFLISVMWGSYFHDFENTLDRHLNTNGQLILYSHFFILAAIMILAANLHLLYADHLPRRTLLDFLFGSAAVFFICKHGVFYHHRQSGLDPGVKKAVAILILMTALYSIDVFLSPPVILSVSLLGLCFALELVGSRMLLANGKNGAA
ncbi:MAG: low temperature requirement protein A [Planctomycetes bacterium]|nr:low temperature requirement protein A [Planctomycetota bacterium]